MGTLPRMDDQIDVPDGMQLEHGRVVPHLDVEQRRARGKAARAEVPRASHGEFTPAVDRVDPVSLLDAQNASRVPELVPVRWGRMLVSPFTFFRGAAAVMAADLATSPTSGLITQACGDAHLSNFGAYASAERHLVFGINDFDETLPGPWEWDLKRLATSFEIAGRDNGYSRKERRAAVAAVGEGYRTAMRDFATMTNLEVWYSHVELDSLQTQLSSDVDGETRKRAQATVDKARTRDSGHALAKLTSVVGGRRRINSDPPLLERVDDLNSGLEFDEVMHLLRRVVRGYRTSLQSDRRHLLEQYRLVDAARKVVGVGSVGTRSWILLLMGRDDSDPLFLQAKEANASVLEAHLGPSAADSHGERVVQGQHLMQATSDIFLGWHRVPAPDGITRDFYVRQLRDWKGSAVVEAMPPHVLALYGRLTARTLARAHARSGDRVAIAAYLGAKGVMDDALVSFADAYADQNERDYDELVAAERDGRIETLRGV